MSILVILIALRADLDHTSGFLGSFGGSHYYSGLPTSGAAIAASVVVMSGWGRGPPPSSLTFRGLRVSAGGLLGSIPGSMAFARAICTSVPSGTLGPWARSPEPHGPRRGHTVNDCGCPSFDPSLIATGP
jgi:hypothetical protein